MGQKKRNTKETVKTLKRIRQLGKAESTALLFLRDICPDMGERTLMCANHCLAVAEIMSRLAADGHKDYWYTVGLMSRTYEMRGDVTKDQSRMYLCSLLRKAGFTSEAVYCIEKLERPDDPRTWTPMMTALVYADTHVTADGRILTSDECCMKHGSMRDERSSICMSCMYARYVLSKGDDPERCENTIRSFQSELGLMA